MGDQTADLRHYYENEARQRARPPLRAGRLDLRAGYLDLLTREGRASVVDIGAGPGRDGEAFRAAGFRFVGVDLAIGNARLAADQGVDVLQGSITDLPIRSSTFDAGWSLSTLMHLDEVAAGRAVDELARVLRPGAPVLIGLWGREAEGLQIEDRDLPGSRRPFHHRSFDHNRELLAARADVEEASLWVAAADDADYQVFRLRTRSTAAG